MVDRNKRTTKTCIFCKKEYQGRKTTKFCSRECRDNNRKKPLTLNCKNCGKKFTITKDKYRRQYCSPTCAYHSLYHSDKKKVITKICEQCKKEFVVRKNKNNEQRNKFCSPQCGNLSRRKRRKINCLICNKEFETNDNRRKYCSIDCAYADRCGEKSHLWDGGDKAYGLDWNIRFKNSIRERDNQVCQLCTKHRTQLKENLSVHHIDYIETNTFKENCVSLCRACHHMMNYKQEYWTNFWKKYLQDKYGYEIVDINQEKLIEKKEKI